MGWNTPYRRSFYAEARYELRPFEIAFRFEDSPSGQRVRLALEEVSVGLGASLRFDLTHRLWATGYLDASWRQQSVDTVGSQKSELEWKKLSESDLMATELGASVNRLWGRWVVSGSAGAGTLVPYADQYFHSYGQVAGDYIFAGIPAADSAASSRRLHLRMGPLLRFSIIGFDRTFPARNKGKPGATATQVGLLGIWAGVSSTLQF